MLDFAARAGIWARAEAQRRADLAEWGRGHCGWVGVGVKYEAQFRTVETF